MISNEQQLYQALVKRYPEALQSITELSFNTDGGRKFISCGLNGFNFDIVSNLAGSETKEKSPDAVFYHDESLYLVEFKERKFDKKDIRAKAHEALLTLFQFSQHYVPQIKREEFFQLNIKFVLVARYQVRRGRPTFEQALEQTYTKSHLANMQGFIYRKAYVVCEPNRIHRLFTKLSQQSQLALTVHDHYGEDLRL